jgi:hypothetical protein
LTAVASRRTCCQAPSRLLLPFELAPPQNNNEILDKIASDLSNTTSATTMLITTEPSITLEHDVYDVDLKFRDTLRQTQDMLDSESSENSVAGAVAIAVGLVGRDPVRLFGLIEVMHTRTTKSWNWATSAAVAFYRLDLSLTFRLRR